jgi:hypothetical protein
MSGKSSKSSKPFLLRRTKLSPSKTRLFVAGCVLDIHQGQGVAYYAISKSGSSEIIAMGTEPTMEEAEARARWTAIQLSGKEEAKAAAASDESAAS